MLSRRTVLFTIGTAGMLLPAAAVSAAGPDRYATRTQITIGTNSYDSVGSSRGDPFAGGTWGNAANNSSFIRRTFGRTVVVKEVQIGWAGSDVTTSNSSITVRLLRPGGTWTNIAVYRNVAINRDYSSANSAQNTLGPQTILINPTTATAIEISMTGNGWFGAGDVRVLGEIP